MIETDAASSASAATSAFIIEDDARVCELVASTLADVDIRSESFENGKTALAMLATRHPAAIFLDVALAQSDAIDVLRGLGKLRYGGFVQLMSSGTPRLLAAIRRIGAREGIALGEPLHKPLSRDAILQALSDAGLRSGAAPTRDAGDRGPIAPE
jgi:DNA-binding NtrC family response regulator